MKSGNRSENNEAALQYISQQHWRNATFTYLASPDYYENKEIVLKEVLSWLPEVNSTIDIGCGDGRFTFQLAQHSKNVVAYDISPALILRAQKQSKDNGLSNITFISHDIDNILLSRQYDRVSCMGVTSCIVDDLKFLRLIRNINRFSQKAAILLMIDTLSTESEHIVYYENGYIAKYRNIENYKAAIGHAGFNFLGERELMNIPERKMVNKLFIFEK